MVKCSVCGAEIKEFYFVIMRVKVGESSPVPLPTKAGLCKECGAHTIFLSVETKDNEILFKEYRDGQTQ